MRAGPLRPAGKKIARAVARASFRMPAHVREFLRNALKEDIGAGDVTSSLTIPKSARSKAEIIAKQGFVVAGLPFAAEVFRMLDRSASFKPLVEDGTEVEKGAVLARVEGKTRALLSGERVALNVLQKLSGVATLTRAFVREAEGTGATILDTRKTTPGMRWLEKYAVRAGGGSNHRFGLYDMILIKDNHIEAAGGITRAVELARKGRPRGMEIEVEAETLDGVREALHSGVDVIMLDNMTLADIRKAVRIVSGRVALEVSGNVNLKTVRKIAQTGVDYISVGALTHSAPAADISMEIKAGR